MDLFTDMLTMVFDCLQQQVCAEWTLGGIPQWVRDLGIPFRTNNTVWEDEMSRITEYVVKYTEPYQAINGGPIILMQIENEYDNMEGSNAGNKEYLQWAANLTQKVAPQTTWVMCSSHDAPAFVVNTCNGFVSSVTNKQSNHH